MIQTGWRQGAKLSYRQRNNISRRWGEVQEHCIFWITVGLLQSSTLIFFFFIHQPYLKFNHSTNINIELYFILDTSLPLLPIPISGYLTPAWPSKLVKNLPSNQEIQVQPLGWKDPLEKETATHSSILAWKIPWTKELYSPWDRKRVRCNSATKKQQCFLQFLLNLD